MEDKPYPDEEDAVTLTSPEKAPFPFTVLIRGARETKHAGWSFEVTGKDPVRDARKTCLYSLKNREHHAYLDFFEKLAIDFGLRLPQNRRSVPPPSFNAAYREVLCENLAPGMRYGYGDPAVIRVAVGPAEEDTWYYLLATSNDAPDSFPLIRSRNLVDWEFGTYVFPQGKKPAWAAEGELVSDYWAPEMHRIGREFRVYFVARDKHSRELCIGMARSSGPEGPFVPDEEPILKGNVIDPHVFVEEDGTALLYWKEDSNDVWPSRLSDLLHEEPGFIRELFVEKEDQITASFIQTLWPWARTLEPMERFFVQQILIETVIAEFSAFRDRLGGLLEKQPAGMQQNIGAILHFMKTPMYAQPLSPGGSELTGEKTKILENDQPWEAHLVEGMWVTKQGNAYYLFYAGNDFSTDQYGIGVALADSPLGPFRKMAHPFLRSTKDWWAPGHPSLVTGPDGKPTLFLHGYFPGKAGYKQFRALLAVPITFEEDRVLVQS
jgi:arabinan endo-1,5-alpha-L-arabinosidase